jgi:NADH-quinone oxidoreductase subunit N
MIEITSPPIILIAILGTIGMILPIIGMARKEKSSNNLYAAIAFGALIASIGYIVYETFMHQIPPAALFSADVLSNDSFSSFFAIAMLIVSIMTTVGSFNFMKNEAHQPVYYSLILLASIGMVLVAYSTDLVMLFVAWELMSIPTYVLAGFLKKNPSSNEAALKYFLFGAVSSAIIIMESLSYTA